MNWKCFSSQTGAAARAKPGAVAAADVVLIRNWSLESSTGAGWGTHPLAGNAQGQTLLELSSALTYAACMSAKWRACLVLSIQLRCHWQLKDVSRCVDTHDKLQKKLWLLIPSSCIPAISNNKIQLSPMKGYTRESWWDMQWFCLGYTQMIYNGIALLLFWSSAIEAFCIRATAMFTTSEVKWFFSCIVMLWHVSKILVPVRDYG